jgi:hypothetical protein
VNFATILAEESLAARKLLDDAGRVQ